MKTPFTRSAGFTLLELLISMAIFLIVGGVALGLVGKSMPLYSRQQGTASLNLAVRSAVSQIEQDAVNAGTGYYVGVTFPDWPVGVSVLRAPAGTCYDSSAHTYSASCFDTLNVITTDLSTPPANLNGPYTTHGAGATATMVVKVPGIVNPATGSNWTASDFAAKFQTGDQILVLSSSSPTTYTTFKLSANATAGVGVITLTHYVTNAQPSAALQSGTNGTGAGIGPPAVPAVSTVNCTQTSAPTNDYLGISMCWNSKLSGSFVANDWILKLSTVTYAVDASNTANPKLTRRVGPPGVNTPDVVAEQIIGFRVGTALWNDGNGTDNYVFEPSQFPDTSYPWVCNGTPPNCSNYDRYNYTRVRSLRVSIIGRTKPSTDPNYKFQNTFDGGAYQIQAVSVVVNPRNLSMKDQ